MAHTTDSDHPRRLDPVDYDTELRRHNEAMRRACNVQVRDHVLDIGCGTGQTTRQAAHTALAGSALGVDISAPAIERARELARAEGLGNVAFERADAQDHPFPAERFDLVISRFGTMFFADPAAAFANLRRALRPAGRLVMMVWRTREHNEWTVAIHDSLKAAAGPGALPSGGPDAFSLAEPPTVTRILHDAGFADITFSDVHEPVYYGPTVASALDWVRGFANVSTALARLEPATADRALGRLREAIVAHTRHDGVWFDSRAWIVTAHRR